MAKELVENALDAGARRIEVELEDGGRALVKVADDGEGMVPEDARLAFERHATSKLASPDDLETIRSFGFRGEALPSIAAVARVRLVTCRPGATEGFEVVVEGGRPVKVGPGPARPGTVVWVRDLFFNTPARREAMRSAPAEAARVADVVATLALAAPDVAVSLASDGRLLWTTPGSGNLVDAVATLLGASAAREMAPVGEGWTGRSGAAEVVTDAVRVTGLAGLPGAARRDGKKQYLFCNGRPISPGLAGRAVEEAYEGLLERGRTPVFVLNLALAPESVDVNIHPAKTQVRFRDYGEVHRAVVSALRRALAGRELFAGRLAGGGESLVAAARDGWDTVGEQLVYGVTAPGLSGGSAAPLGSLEPLGQVGGVYLAARGPDGLYLIDQHAAHERIVYERLLAATGRADLPAAQPLAIPETLDLGPGEEEVLERSLDFLRAVGFEIEPFGGRTVVIRAVPAVLAGVPPARLVSDFLDRAGEERASGRGGLLKFDRLVAARTMAACKAALKAGESICPAEMRALLADLAATAEPRTCPHGRPTVIRVGLADLERWFGRA